MHYLKNYLLAICALLFTSLLSAQTSNSVRVRILDSSTDLPIEFATVYLVPEDTTSKERLYALTDTKALAVIKNVKNGSYIFKAEMMGYNFKEISLKMDGKFIDLGEIKMDPDISLLEQAVVTAVGNPVVIKKDTIEFNAASFKTTDGDMLEALLKKLPGVEVSSDGSVTVNGEEVTKIQIDGKTFFLDDPKVAMSNIPAQIVDKVKVIEQKSEQAQFTGIDDGEEETIIDLSIKPGMMKGWFGSVTGGGGLDIADNDDVRWQGSTMTGSFTDDTQLSIIGNGNNTNNRGFNDMAGSMNQRTMRGGGSNGITSSWMGGVNANTHLLEDNTMKVGGNYMYSGSDVDSKENSVKETFLPDAKILRTENEQMSFTHSQGHRAGVEMDYKVTEKSSVLFRPYYNYNSGRYMDSARFSSENSQKGLINDGYSSSSGITDSWGTGGILLLRQKIGKTPGRTISASINYSLLESYVEELNESLTRDYSDGLIPDSTFINQRNFQNAENYALSGRLSYTEPFGKNFYMETSYSYKYNKNNADKLTFDFNAQTGTYDILNTTYSSSYENTFINQVAELKFMKQEEKYNAQLGFSVQPGTTISVEKFLEQKKDSVLKYSVVNFAPSARFTYKFSDTKNMSFFYYGRTSQPSITQLQPVPDNSNPLYIKLGNPSLQPRFYNTLRAYYSVSNRKNFSSFNLRMNISHIKDDIINANWYNSSGVEYSAPINSEEGTYSSSIYLTYNSPIAKSDFSVSSYANFRISSGLTYTGIGDVESIDEIINDLLAGRTTSMTVSENIKFTYRNDHVEAIFGGGASYSNAWYSIQQQEKPATWTNTIMAELNSTLPWGMELKTDANYNFFVGFEDGYGDSQFLWNAEISQLLFNKQATIRFKVYDILNEAKSVFQTTTDNYVEDVQRNTLGRYCMLSFSYRFGKYNNKQIGGSRRKGHGGRSLKLSH